MLWYRRDWHLFRNLQAFGGNLLDGDGLEIQVTCTYTLECMDSGHPVTDLHMAADLNDYRSSIQSTNMTRG